MNRPLFGDNLKWLCDTKVLPGTWLDLEYLDPPFNSKANGSVLFKGASGEANQTRFHAEEAAEVSETDVELSKAKS